MILVWNQQHNVSSERWCVVKLPGRIPWYHIYHCFFLSTTTIKNIIYIIPGSLLNRRFDVKVPDIYTLSKKVNSVGPNLLFFCCCCQSGLLLPSYMFRELNDNFFWGGEMVAKQTWNRFSYGLTLKDILVREVSFTIYYPDINVTQWGLDKFLITALNRKYASWGVQ